MSRIQLAVFNVDFFPVSPKYFVFASLNRCFQVNIVVA